MMLEVSGIESGYGQATILRGVSFGVQSGEIHCLMGRNGAGKTTIVKTIMGLLRLRAGDIRLDGQSLARLPAHEIPKAGIGLIPQGRRLFSELTVAQNLEVGLMTKGKTERSKTQAIRERALDLFPRLRERLNQRAQTLSGGEQQMLATARALCIEPRILLLDEPTEGLQPSMIETIQDVVQRLRQDGTAILLVEQKIASVLKLADRVTFIENGESRETIEAIALHANDEKLHRYLGV